MKKTLMILLIAILFYLIYTNAVTMTTGLIIGGVVLFIFLSKGRKFSL